MFKSIFSTGLGGQGVLTLAGLLAAVAAEKGLKVSLFNAKGMAQRGGRVTSELRLSDDPELEFGARISPGRADILIGMEIGESINSLPFLREGGSAFLLDYAKMPAEMVLKKQPYPSLEQARELFLRRTPAVYALSRPAAAANIFLLGVLSALAQAGDPALSFFSAADLQQAIGARLKSDLEANLQSFKEGYAHGQSLPARI